MVRKVGENEDSRCGQGFSHLMQSVSGPVVDGKVINLWQMQCLLTSESGKDYCFCFLTTHKG